MPCYTQRDDGQALGEVDSSSRLFDRPADGFMGVETGCYVHLGAGECSAFLCPCSAQCAPPWSVRTPSPSVATSRGPKSQNPSLAPRSRQRAAWLRCGGARVPPPLPPAGNAPAQKLDINISHSGNRWHHDLVDSLERPAAIPGQRGTPLTWLPDSVFDLANQFLNHRMVGVRATLGHNSESLV